MKKVILLLIILSATVLANAQPQAIPYQAVARDISGNLIADQNITLRFSIQDNGPIPVTYYRETHAVSTNALGLFSVSLGQGTPEVGTFGNIYWGAGANRLKTEMDVAGGTSYSDMGTSPMLSVPYALYAAKSGNGMTDGSAQGSTMYWNGAVWDNNVNLFNDGQNVGIGTVNPSARLEVSGTTKTTNLAVIGGASAGFLLQSDATGNASWVSPASIIGPETDPQVSSASMNKVPKWNGSSLADGSIYDDGNVGIGTANPLSKFQVNGQITIIDGNEQEGRVLTSDDNGTARWASPGGAGDCFINWQAFTTPGTTLFTVPLGVSKIKVAVQGGGAGGICRADNVGGGGGAGGYAESIFNVVPGQSITLTVGAGGLQNQNGVSSTVTAGVINIMGGGGFIGGANLLTGGIGGDAGGYAYLLIRGSSGCGAAGGMMGQGGGGISSNYGGGGGGIGGGNGSVLMTGAGQAGAFSSGSGGGGGGTVNSAYGNGGSGKIVVFW
jgi:hypothetical protein